MNIENLIRLFERLKSARATHESHWQEITDYFLPTKATITKQRTPGQKLRIDKYDSTPVDSLQVFAAGLHSYLTNPASRWFNLGIREKELAQIKEVKDFLAVCQEELFRAINNSNFNQQIHEGYIDFGSFGTSCIYEEEDLFDDIRFFARPPAEIFIMENAREEIDMLYRYCSYTARQAYEKWGGNAGEKVLAAIESNKYDENFDFLHLVMPRYERIAGKLDSLNKPFASLYIEISQKKLVSQSGYDEFPFFVARNLKLSGEPWGYSQCMIALPDAKTLNAMTKTLLKGAQKQVDPPIVVPNDGYLLPFRITPGAVNIKSEDTKEKIDVLNFGGNLPIGLEMQEIYRTQIRRALFVDLFLFFATLQRDPQKMTATEVRERINEKMLILGPILGRLMNELLDPLIHRTFNILMRNGKLPETPEILIGKEYKIEYISPLAKAQKLSDAQSINDFLLTLKGMAEINPEVIDNLNFDKTAQELSEIYNVNPEILRSDDEVQAIREQRLQAQQAMQQMEMLKAGAGAAVDLSQADKNLKEEVKK